jgi:hypothetical protein
LLGYKNYFCKKNNKYIKIFKPYFFLSSVLKSIFYIHFEYKSSLFL